MNGLNFLTGFYAAGSEVSIDYLPRESSLETNAADDIGPEYEAKMAISSYKLELSSFYFSELTLGCGCNHS